MTSVPSSEENAVLARLWELAGDVGRLQRRFASNEHAWTGEYICDRIAGHIADLDLMIRPSAAQLVAWTAPGDHEAIDAAIRLVDDHWSRLQTRMGAKP